MILESLVTYYESLVGKNEITLQGWCNAEISYAIVISELGELISIICLKTEKVYKNKKIFIRRPMDVPEAVIRTGSKKESNFLWDNSSYLLGIDNKNKKDSCLEKFAISKDKHISILKSVDCIFAKAIIRFFEKWDPKKADEHIALKNEWDDIIAGGNLVFELNGMYAHEDTKIRKAWEKSYQNEKDSDYGLCLVTGKKAEISRLHNSIKKIKGSQPSGALLVSFNEPAFESYGKTQGFNAPVSKYAMYAYTTSLNYLLANGAFTRISDTTILSWSEDANPGYQEAWECSLESTIENQKIIRSMFDNISKGKAICIDMFKDSLALDQQFSILGLSPNVARLSVRFFYRDTFENILSNLKKHYNRMEIVKPPYDSIEYLGVDRMLQETVNKKSKDKEPRKNMAASVLKAILSNDRYPEVLYQGVLMRIRAEQSATVHGDEVDKSIKKRKKVDYELTPGGRKDQKFQQITRGRAAIIKAYLIKNTNVNKEEITVALNEESNNIAYILGRMFSILEQIQEAGNRNINTTIKDRYFNSACATPATIFPILLKLKNSHIRKMKSKGGSTGLIVYYEKQLGNLQNKLVMTNDESAYPKRLSLEEQGLFILGYYHQTQKKYEGKKEEGKNNE